MATQTTGGGSTTSFSNTPQAQADSYATTEDAAGLYGTGIILLNVMADDLGGAAKTLFSVDDGTQQSSVVVKNGDSDLLNQDTAYSDTSLSSLQLADNNTTDHSALGAKIWITSDGQVAYDTSSSTAIQALSAGQSITDTFVYAIRLGNGTLSWTTVTLTITGANDKPALGSVTTAPAGITEAAGQTGLATADTSSATFNFTDVDLADTHTVSAADPTIGWTGGTTLPSGLAGALSVANALTLTKTDSTGTGSGSVGVSFSVADKTFDFLAQGETLSVTYTVTIDDGHGGTSTQPVTFTVTGTNDKPMLAADTTGPHSVSGELANSHGSATADTASVTLGFTDVDLNDTHTLSSAVHAIQWSGGATLPAGLATTLAGAVSLVKHDSSGSGSGSVDVNFSAADANFDFLAQGETLTVSYDVTVKDNNNAVSTQTVTFVVTGANDAPVLAADTGSPHAFTEVAPPTSTPDAFTTTLNFTDLDLTDTHGATVGTPTVTSSGPLSAAQLTALHTALDGALQAHVTTDGPSGQVTAAFSAPDSTFDFLAAGQTLTITYNVSVSDNHSGTSNVQPVTVTITGTNEDPVITSTAQAGSVKEDVAVDGAGALNASGAVTYTDVDLIDTHTASFTQQAGDTSHVGTFSLDQSAIASGSVGWSFQVADDAVDALAEGQQLVQHYDVKVADNHGGFDVQTVTVTITGTNEDPVITSTAQAGSVKEDVAVDGAGALNASGAVTYTDVDLIDTHTASFTQQAGDTSHVGTFSLDPSAIASGSVGWSFQVADDAVDALAEGQQLVQHYDVKVADNHGGFDVQTVTVTITGTNEDPVITSTAQAGSVKEDVAVDGSGALNASGAVTYTDVDLIDTHTASFTQQAGDTSHVGTFSLDQSAIASGSVGWSFQVADDAVDALAEGQQLVQHYDVKVADNHGGFDTQTVTVTITGTNEDPVITSTAQAGSVKEDVAVDGSGALNASGAVTYTDVDLIDTHTASFTQQAGDTSHVGTFSLDQSAIASGSVGWSFQVADDAVDALAEGQQLVQHYDVKVADNHGGFDVQTVTVTITGTNEDPVITSTAQAGSVKEDVAVDGSGALNASGAVTYTDVDLIDTHTASFTQQAGDTSHVGTFSLDQSAIASGSVGWSFQVADDAVDALAEGQQLVQHYDVKVADNHGGFDTQTVTVTITGTNEDPVITSTAQAGSVKEDVAVDGSGALNASGAVTYTDVDLIDTHTASFTQQAGDTSHVGTFSLDPSAIASGSVGWSFQVADDAVDALAEGQQLVQHYDVKVADNHGGFDVQTVTVTITGTNEDPVITSTAQAGSVKEDVAVDGSGALNASGAVTYTDVDLIDTHTASFTQQAGDTSHVGTFSLDQSAIASGSVGWSFQVADDAVDALAEGQQLVQHYDVKVADNHGGFDVQTVTVTITGTNEDPVITSTAQAGSVKEDVAVDGSGALNASGAVTYTDVDLIDTHTASFTQQAGDTSHVGTFRLDPSAIASGSVGWSFQVADDAVDALAEGQQLVQHYDVKVADNHGGFDVQTVTVTITGTNEDPVITSTAQAGSVKEDVAVDGAGALNASGAVTYTDVDLIDTHTASFTQQAGDTSHVGTFTLDPSAIASGSVGWSFQVADDAVDALAEGQQLVQHYDVKVADNHGGFDTQTVTVTITGTNEDPVITSTAQAGSVKEDVAVDGSGALNASGAVTYTDVDLLDTHTASFTQQAGDTSHVGTFSLDQSAIASGSVGWSFQVADDAVDALAEGQQLVQHYDVKVADNHGGFDVQTVTVTITGTNEDPVITSTAQAGSVKEDVAVDGSGALNASGAVTYTDVDLIDTHTASFTQQAGDTSHVGTFSLDQSAIASGSVGWSFQVTDDAVDALAEGQQLVQHYDVKVADNHGGFDTQTVTVTITGTNEAPVITVGASDHDTAGLTETNLGLSTSGTLTVNDPDLSDTVTASVVTGVALSGVTGGLTSADVQNMLSITSSQPIAADPGDHNNLAWAFNSGSQAFDFLADGQTLTLTYTVKATDPQSATDTHTVAITITGTNDAPVLDAHSGSLSYTENQAATAIDSLITVSDVDSANLTGASVSITGAFVPGEDVLGFVNQNGITGSYNSGTGVLTLSGSSSVANYQAALRSVTYANTSDNPSGAARTVSFQVDDGQSVNHASNVVTATVAVTPVNDAPVLNAHGGSLSYTAGGAPAAIDTLITGSDVDSANLTGATVSITGNFAAGQDVLSFVNQSGITGSYNAATGVLTLSGTATVAQYQTALESVAYSDSSSSPSTASRTVSYQVTDDHAAASNVVTATVTVTGSVDHAPTNLTFTPVAQNGNATTLGTFQATDPDGDTLTYTSSDPTHFTINASTGAISGITAGLNEQVTITVSDGTLSTSQTYNVLLGSNGSSNDTLIVSSVGGNATITDGLNGNDTITGTSGTDYMWGGQGNDTFTPGLGNDYMSGGGSNNTYVFNTTLNATTNLDHIADFSHGIDVLSLDHTIFNVGYNSGTGALNASEFSTVISNGVGAANAHLVYDTTSHTLYYDTDGAQTTSGRTAFAVLDNAPTLASTDFHIF